MNKLIPIITDEHADMEKGTGVVKITPAHDPNDFEVGNRHNLPRIVIMNKDATMNENVPLKYQGMNREKCREEVLKDLEDEGLLLSVEPLVHEVGHSERTGVMIEPYLSKQWFVKMGPLSEKVLNFQKDKDKKVHFVPPRFEKILNHWMSISYDWCISRQLWWGHRIPAWYRGDELYVGMEAPQGEGWVQDDDVLDTWFSSALWPFSTLGWPNNTKDFQRYFPTDTLVTGYDIIFFWVARMVFQSEYLNDVRPFKDCVIHGLIRDKQGRKMSKSLNNGVDPFEMVDKYGADSLRYYLSTDGAMGLDIRFDEVKLTSTWNYINKIWNASRFVLMNIESIDKLDFTDLKACDKWILSKYNNLVKSVTRHMDKYEFNLAGSEIYEFTWNCFCDNYIEMAKFNIDSLTTKSVLCKVLSGILKMLHPFMPFVTEEIYQMLPVKDSESIMISEYPVYDKNLTCDESIIDNALEFITLFRNKKAELGIRNFNIKNYIEDDELSLLITSMLKLNNLEDGNYSLCEKVKLNDLAIDILYNDEVNHEEERNNLLKEKEKLEASIERRKKLLSNENYVNKAPQAVVDNDRINLKKEEEMLSEIVKKLEI